MIIRFEVPMIPAAKGRPRFARVGKFVRTFTPEKTETAERNLIALAAPHAPAEPMRGPITFIAEFKFPIPKGWPRWKREVARSRGIGLGSYHHVSRPDLDNLLKLVLDALTSTGRWWLDDSQIVSVWATKRYSESPGTRVEIAELDQAVR